MNISGVVVQATQTHFDQVKEALRASGVCEIHFEEKEKGKIVVTIEGEGVEEEIRKLGIIRKIPHVLAADMVHSYSGEELEQNMARLEREGAVPQILDADDLKPGQIHYGGDVRNYTGK